MITSWEHPIEHAENISEPLRTSWKHLENVYWTSVNTREHSENIWKQVRTSENVLLNGISPCFETNLKMMLPCYCYAFFVLAFSRSLRIDPATAQKFRSRLVWKIKQFERFHTCTAGGAGDYYEVCERGWVSGRDHSIKMRWGGSGWYRWSRWDRDDRDGRGWVSGCSVRELWLVRSGAIDQKLPPSTAG